MRLHDQRPPALSPDRAARLRAGGTGDLAALESELRELELLMAQGSHDARTLARYARAQEQLEHAGGYDWRERATAAVRGLGFSDDELERPLSSFSGGELTRASLARALAAQPDILLLDEPTNHLDVETIEWLEDLLRTIDAGVILVAHDRWFLEAVTTAVLELERGRSASTSRASGTSGAEQAARELHACAQQRPGRRGDRAARALRRTLRRQGDQGEPGALQAAPDRPAATNLRDDGQRAPHARLRVPHPEPARTDRARGGRSDARPRRPRTRQRRLARARARRARGARRTERLRQKHAARDDPRPREPRAGQLRLGHGVQVGYFSQHEAELDERGTVLEAVLAATGLRRADAQKLLGQFLFSGWEAHEKPVSALSGGERRRLALAIVVAGGGNLLVLDEPTNHLDLESREALEAALDAFPGTVLLVSHDRALLDAVSRRLVAIEDGKLVSYPGGWADYRREEPEAVPPSAEPKPSPSRIRSRAAGTQRHRDPARARRSRDHAGRGTARRARAAARRGLGQRRARRRAQRARDDLAALLGRWEELFEAESAEPQRSSGANVSP